MQCGQMRQAFAVKTALDFGLAFAKADLLWYKFACLKQVRFGAVSPAPAKRVLPLQCNGPRLSQRVQSRARQKKVMAMQQQISVITLGIKDLCRSRNFYANGFGWVPVFENAEIIFYQMNGLVLGTWLEDALLTDMKRPAPTASSASSLAHNVPMMDDVEPLMARLIDHGGKLLRPADAPPYGGLRGYISDPDGHAWEIAWNPAWAIDDKGHVTFGL